MDLLKTMFSSRTSMSPAKPNTSNAKKRPYEPSPTRASNGSDRPHKSSKKEEEPKFSFEDVKTLLDNLLAQDKKKLESSVNSGIKQINFDQVKLPGHSVEKCQKLTQKLVLHTRRIRTTEEVLQDIKSNLGKRHYTDLIQRFGLEKELPKRPASPYFLFHKERFAELRDEMMAEFEELARRNPGDSAIKPPQAATIATRVSAEWKSMAPEERAEYQRRYEELISDYEKEIKKMGLNKIGKPKRPKSARNMFIESKLSEMSKPPKNKAKLNSLKQKFADEYDSASNDLKEPWMRLAKDEQAAYKREMENYCQSNPHLDRNDIIKVREKKVKIAPPTPPRNPCRIYMDKKLPENLEGQELKEAENALREKFNKLSVKKTLRYIKKAVKEKEEYDEAIGQFVIEHPDIPVPKILRPNLTKAQQSLYETHVEMKPVPPAQTAYLHFCSQLMNAATSAYDKPTKRLQSASAAWLALSNSEKAEVYKEHIEAMKKYIQEMDQWLADKDKATVERIIQKDQKCAPEVWRRKLLRHEKSLAKREFD